MTARRNREPTDNECIGHENTSNGLTDASEAIVRCTPPVDDKQYSSGAITVQNPENMVGAFVKVDLPGIPIRAYVSQADAEKLGSVVAPELIEANDTTD